MCGRFINTNKINKIKKIFDIEQDIQPLQNSISYNIAPSNNINIIINTSKLKIENAQWGIKYDNNFNNQQTTNQIIINSRLETITEKIIFRESFFNKRCLVPANGWYEWSFNNGKKIPYFIEISPQETVFFAGIWKLNNHQKKFSIITKAAHNLISNIHSRMPVIFSIDEAIKYIEEKKENNLNKNFVSDLEQHLNYYSVSKYVNSPLNNSKDCIKPMNKSVDV